MHFYLIFAIHVWNCITASLIKELFVKKKMAIQIVHISADNANTESLFKALAILSLLLLTDFFKLQFMHHNKFNYLLHPLKIHGAL